MSAQAKQLENYISELLLLIQGSKGEQVTRSSAKTTQTIVPGSEKGPVSRIKRVAVRAKEIRPDQVIPFDDDENFKDF